MRATFAPRRLDEATQAYVEFLSGGMPCVLAGVSETLQCRNELDRTNWLTLIGICNEAIALGAGAFPIPVAIRCTSNRSYTLSYTDTLILMKNLRAWAAGAQANWWRLKDLVATVASGEDLNTINLDGGWP